MKSTFHQLENIKVLIVEDDDRVAEIIERSIKRYYNNQVICFREINPYNAVECLITQDDVALCLLDLGFPGMQKPGSTEAFDAIDAAIKKHRLDTTLVVVSGTSDEGIIKSIQRAGSKYLSKEETIVNPRELLKILSEVMAKRTSGSSGREQLTKVEILANQVNYRVDRVCLDMEDLRSQVRSNSEELYGGPGRDGMDTRLSNLSYSTTREIQLLREAVAKQGKTLDDFQEIINFIKGTQKTIAWIKENYMLLISILIGLGGILAAWFRSK